MEDRRVCKSGYKKNRRKNIKTNTLIQNQQPKIDNVNNGINPSVSAYENHRSVIVRPSIVGKTNYMIKILKKKVAKNHII